MSTKLFNTHHSPIGAWASLTFGNPKVGLSIDHEDPKVKNTGALLIGTVAGSAIKSICFGEGSFDEYCPASESQITRELTPSKDIYAYENIRFTTYTNPTAIPDPKVTSIKQSDCYPGILMDVEIDNTKSTESLTAFWGLILNEAKKAYASEDKELCSLVHKNSWEFVVNQPDAYMIRGLDAFDQLINHNHIVQQNGPAFFCLDVPAGTKKTLTISWSVYTHEGSFGEIETDYYYTQVFDSLRSVTNFILDHADDIRSIADVEDKFWIKETTDIARGELFSQAVRAYYASSQLLISKDNQIHWNTVEGGYLWRNTMDLCADHIVWELKRNPWIVRNMLDDFLAHYTYYDTVTFSGVNGTYPGGISFTHDMGCFSTYSKKGYSAYERENASAKGFYFYMTTEELLNGIYCICSYVISTGDTDWLSQYPNLLDDLITSLENRDGFNDEMRNGILKASTTRGGECALESTTYDALDHSLLKASGNIYVFIKTWCSLILLKECCKMVCADEIIARITKMIDKCANSTKLFVSDSTPWLKANAYEDINGAVCAAAEPLAVLHMLGVLDVHTQPELTSLIRKHLEACLQPGVCIDDISNGLRLSSTSKNTWPSKSVLTLYTAETILNMNIPGSLIDETIGWAQVSASKSTISDQIISDTREVIGAPYYPRIVTAVLWL